MPNYIGVAPNCRPECSINAECPGNLACQNEKCVDPCPGSCGFNADCTVANHVALCNCLAGYTGDPFSGCSQIICKFDITNFNLLYFLHKLFDIYFERKNFLLV